MERRESSSKALILLFGTIFIGYMFDFIVVKGLVDKSIWIIVGPVFNLVLAGLLAYFILRDEFTEWYKHFSIKWVILGIPFLAITGIIFGLIWKLIHHETVANSVNSVLTWNYVFTKASFMIMGEEILSIAILYALWRKLNLKFWHASFICAVLFALWHLPTYGYAVFQVLVAITPSRMVLNYLFKKTNSIWVTFVVHFIFDIITFLPVLLKH